MRGGTAMRGLKRALFPATVAIGTIFQATNVDARNNKSANYTLAWRIKDFISHLGISGVDTSFIDGAPAGSFVSTNRFKPSLGKALNGMTILGLVGYYGAKFFPIPGKSFIRPIAKGAIVGGIVGGILDPDVGQAQILQVNRVGASIQAGGSIGMAAPQSIGQLGQY